MRSKISEESSVRESSDCGWWTIYSSCLSLLSTFSQNYLKPKVSSSASAILQICHFFLGHFYCDTLWRLKEKISKHFVATTFALRMSFSIKLEGDIISFENLMGVKKMIKDTKCSKRCSCFCCYVVSVYKKMSRLQSLQFEGSIRGLP